MKLFIALMLLLCLVTAASSSDASPGSWAGKRVLIHLKTGFKQDDNQPCVAFDMAFSALKQGAKVEMFFDAAPWWILRSGKANPPAWPTRCPIS
jgi:hypothetical protein